MTLDDLLAREGIRDLVARYNSYGDSGKFERLWPLFAPDAVMEIISADGDRATHTGLDEIKRIFTGANDRVVARSDQQAPPMYIRHSTATHQIDLVDTDHATGRCYFSVIIGPVGGRAADGPAGDGRAGDACGGLDHWGRYIDHYIRIDGTWRFGRRKVYVDGSVAGSWFAAP